MGPITPTSLGGSKYVLVEIDTRSRFSWVRMLKEKSEAKEEVLKIIRQLENRFEKNVKKIICDGGKEFVNKILKEFCENRVINLIVTTPYTPQHNGIVERTNRTLMDKARTLRADSGLPKELWAELINTANFLRVRTTEKGKSSYEKLFNVKPNLNRIKRFGCRVYVTQNSYKRKLDERSEKGVLVGYEQDFGVYRVLLDNSSKITRTRDVSFVQTEMPYKIAQLPEKAQSQYVDDSDYPIEPAKNQLAEELIPTHESNHHTEDRQPITVRLCIPNTQNETRNIQHLEQNNLVVEGVNKGNTTTRPRWEWELREKAPKEISSKLSAEHIISSRTRQLAQALMTKLIDWTKDKQKAHAFFGELINQKTEAFNKTDLISSIAMYFETQENKENPDSLPEAKIRHVWFMWREAYFSKLDSIAEQGVFDVYSKEDVPQRKTIISTRWVFNKKFTENGNLKQYKARCVARGFKKKEGIDYQETFSPTGRLSTLRYIISYTVQTIYTTLPDGFIEWVKETKPEFYEDKRFKQVLKQPLNFVLKLNKSLYGLKQAARSWYQTLSGWLVAYGFRISQADPCLFIKRNTLLFAWVDDILLIGEESDQIITELKKHFKIKDLGLASHVLGIKVTRNNEEVIQINQSHYIEELLKKYNMEDCKVTLTPMQSNLKLEPETEAEQDELKMLNEDYRSAIGSLNYLSQCT
ncbi:hypothetical protein O181_003299 [Austropuccinia psidii MF-1]|uniref:Integrase catalytic domain-containing protein n=1 Tax=Austropuccinia psidii MF-1 TaxID=1389203 RepID=A0A9Q3GDR0_9BASI|nr:hypothetical protein [Austropuccinia psidii MF-1]